MKKKIAFLIIVLVESVLLILHMRHPQQDIPAQALVSPLSVEPSQALTGWILFVSDISGNKDIYQMDLKTKNIVDLTNNPADDMNPQISPDGRYIVFYSNRSGNNQIYRMDLTGESVIPLTHDTSENYDPSYSPDGTQIVFKSTVDDQHGDIFIMNADGTEQKNLTAQMSSTEEWDPRFSQDGKRIYFVKRQNADNLTDDIYSMSIDGSNIAQLTNNNVPDWYMAVNPKDGSILYVSKDSPSGSDHIFRMNADGTHKVKLTRLPGGNADPSWDPTGKKIIFINDHNEYYNLYMMNADGSNIRKIDNTQNDELSPIFFPENAPKM